VDSEKKKAICLEGFSVLFFVGELPRNLFGEQKTPRAFARGANQGKRGD